MNRHAFMLAASAGIVAFAAQAGLAEPGKALIEERWANGLGSWVVSNRADVLTVTVKDGVFRVANEKPVGSKNATYFTVASDFVKVTPGTPFAAIMESRGNLGSLTPVTLFRAQENKLRSFVPATAVLWFTADKKPLLAQDATGVMLPTGSSFGFKAMGDEFVRTLHIDTVPEGAAYAKLQIGGQHPQFRPGDWLELRRLALNVRDGANGDWDFGDVVSPTMERVSPSPDPNTKAPFVFQVKDASAIAKLTVKLDGKDLDAAKIAKKAIAGGVECAYVPETPWAYESLHRFAVEATDAAGNIARETLAYYCGPVLKGDEVRVRDDGMILMGGKPFFPVGTSGARLAPPNGYDAERLFSEFEENGLNSVGCCYAYRAGRKAYYDGGHGRQGPCPIEEMEAYLATARRHGVYLRLEPASRDYGTEKRVNEFIEALKYYRDHPEVMCYCLADDTASHVTPDVLRNDYNIVHAIDNLRLTTQADANDYAGRYEPFAKCTDVFVMEIYPFRNAEHEPNGLAQVLKDCEYGFDGLRKSGEKDRSLWTIPQAFAGWGLWKKYPSREIVRAQTYLAIIAGCRGVTYYTYWSWSPGADGFAHNPKHTEELYTVTRELKAIRDDLTSRDAKVQPKITVVTGPKKDPCGYSSVNGLLKDGADGKGQLFMAASSMMKGPSAWVEIPLDAKRIETLFENGRKVTFKNGVLMDSFAPGEVHVYRLVR